MASNEPQQGLLPWIRERLDPPLGCGGEEGFESHRSSGRYNR